MYEGFPRTSSPVDLVSQIKTMGCLRSHELSGFLNAARGVLQGYIVDLGHAFSSVLELLASATTCSHQGLLHLLSTLGIGFYEGFRAQCEIIKGATDDGGSGLSR